VLVSAAVAGGQRLKNSALDKIAEHLRHGLTVEDVARSEELTRQQVRYRVDAMRQRLAKETGDVGWLEANPVEVGRGWFGEPVQAHLTAPSRALAERS